MANDIDVTKDASLDFIVNGAAMGDTASRFLQMGCNASALRPYIAEDGKAYITSFNSKGEMVPVLAANATLRKDEWKQIDDAVLKVSTARLGGIQDLIGLGLTYNIGNGLGTTVLEYEKESDLEDAEMTMDGISRVNKDRPEYDSAYLPLPIIHKDFAFGARQLAASRTRGQSLDTATAELATRKVNEKLETILFTGSSSYTFASGVIYGYMDAPDKNTVTLALAWDDSAKTGALIVDDVLDMIQANVDAKHYGPYMLYVPTGYQALLEDDHTSGYPKTIRSRLKEIDSIVDVKVADKLTAANVVLAQMTPDVVRLVQGLPVTPVEWKTEGNMRFNYKVMTIQVPQVRSDANSNSGICLLAA